MPRFSPKRTGQVDVDRNLDQIAKSLNDLVSKVQDSGNIRIGGSLGLGNAAAATTPGSVVYKLEIFDENGRSLGFIPVYATIS